jgi:hypothetical protein
MCKSGVESSILYRFVETMPNRRVRREMEVAVIDVGSDESLYGETSERLIIELADLDWAEPE